jgi:hypothetical protein
MEQRLKNLEDLCELLTKESVEQSKMMIEMNKNLINEIRCLRESVVKQDTDFEEFKNLLRKIYELNLQNSNFKLPAPSFIPGLGAPIPGGAGSNPQQQQNNLSQFPQGRSSSTASQMSSNTTMNASFMTDQINQSMMNNLSFASDMRTPFNPNQMPSLFASQNQNLNTTSSNYSITSSASNALINQKPQQQQSQFPPFNPQQPPPPVVNKPVLTQQPVKPQQQQNQAPFRFAPTLTTTSTPQISNQLSFAKSSPQIAATGPTVPQQQQMVKPPSFDLSPSKPLASANQQQQQQSAKPATELPKLNLFGQPKTTNAAPPQQNIFGGENF